ncbi:MAG: hypothetical protein IH851_04720 [Armatimonadetes bacterium]|nr:hypothetical protein [Armatimonadota bacterium]
MRTIARILRAGLPALVLSLALIQGASAYKVVFVVENGAPYPLRWGEAELSDPAEYKWPEWGTTYAPGAVGVQIGAILGIYIDWEGGPKMEWQITGSTLVSNLTSAMYWSEGLDPHGWHNPDKDKPNGIHWFPEPVPGFIEWATLTGDVITGQPPMGPMGAGKKSELFVILDNPKIPMTPAWVTLLRYSCKWARYRRDQSFQSFQSYWDAETSNENDARQRITFGLFAQKTGQPLNGGFDYFPWDDSWIKWNSSRNGYDYHLKDVLDQWEPGGIIYGDCMDVSVMNAYAFCTVGLSSHRTRQLTENQTPFNTNPICGIGDDPYWIFNYDPYPLNFHSVTVKAGQTFSQTTRLWDATAAQWEDLLGNDYRFPPAYRVPGQDFWRQRAYWRTVLGPDVLGLVSGVLEPDEPIRAGWFKEPGDPVEADWIPGATTLPINP